MNDIISQLDKQLEISNDNPLKVSYTFGTPKQCHEFEGQLMKQCAEHPLYKIHTVTTGVSCTLQRISDGRLINIEYDYKKFGCYSKTQRTLVGSALYKNKEGNEVEVTCVGSKQFTYDFIKRNLDGSVVCEVTEYVRNVSDGCFAMNFDKFP